LPKQTLKKKSLNSLLGEQTSDIQQQLKKINDDINKIDNRRNNRMSSSDEARQSQIATLKSAKQPCDVQKDVDDKRKQLESQLKEWDKNNNQIIKEEKEKIETKTKEYDNIINELKKQKEWIKQKLEKSC